jgi:predicted MFS family arabinose efflux permease
MMPALAGFVLASAACAVVPSVGLLIAARVVQGLLGAPMVPLAMGLLLGRDGAAKTMPPSAGIMLFAAPALGPALGGLLIGAFGWRSVFLINVPVGLAALAGLRLLLRRAGPGPRGDPSARLDLPGLVLLSAGLGLTTYGASQGPGHGWLSAASAPAWLGGLALIGGYLLWYRGRGTPAVNLSVLGAPRRALTLALACVASVVLFSVLFLAPVYLQDIQHHSTGVTGLALLPQGVVMGLASWLGSVLIERGQGRPATLPTMMAGGLALLAVATLGMLLLGPTTPVWASAALFCGRGVALGLTVQPLVMELVGDLPAAKLPDANTLFSITERQSGSFGIALLATYYAQRVRITGVPVAAFHDCAVLLAAASAAGALAALGLRRGTMGTPPD